MKGLAQGNSAGESEQGWQPGLGLTEHRGSTCNLAGGSAGAHGPGGEKGWEGFGQDDGWCLLERGDHPHHARHVPFKRA